MATVTLDRVRKVFANGLEAVRGVDLGVGDGEFVVLVGPSGCGKTTVLRMVAGLEDITHGTVAIDGRIVNDIAPKKRDVAMVFQNYALYPHMTVAENMSFALRVKRLPRNQISQRVRDASATLGLSDLLDRKPGQLSGGQRQRVAMGRAIVREPAVFLMDEPLSNLDAKLRMQLRAEVSRIQRQLGVATLYVTHDQTEAMTMGDRIAVLRGGLLQQYGPPQCLYDRPANLFVAGFIGSPAMNLYEATLEKDLRCARLGSQHVPLSPEVVGARPGLAAYAGAKLVVGIRPDNLRVAPGTLEQALAGEVDLVETLGSELLVHFSLDARRVHAEATEAREEADLLEVTQLASAARGIAKVDVRTDVRVGERVHFELDSTRLQFFDLGTGNAIWA